MLGNEDDRSYPPRASSICHSVTTILFDHKAQRSKAIKDGFSIFSSSYAYVRTSPRARQRGKSISSIIRRS